MSAPVASKLLCEFVGTFLLVFTIGCNVVGKSGDWGGVSIACVLMVMIYSFGGISGGNFNPAVSFSLGLANAMPWKDVAVYSVIQIVGGILAAISYSTLYGAAFHLAPAKGFGIISAGACELIYTFMLCFVVLNVAVAKTNCGNQFYGLAIGFVIVAGAYGAGHVSGGCFNPAVAFGIDVAGAYLGFGWSFAYAGCELVGAFLAAFLFRVVRPGHYDDNCTEAPMLSKLTSEFLGTFILVLTVGLNVLCSSPAVAFSIAASLMCMIYALGDVSGANFNPAVTLAILVSGQTTVKDACLYVAVQLVGGIAGAFSYAAIYAPQEDKKRVSLGPVAQHTWMQVGVAEVVFTAILCMVVLCVAVSPKTNSQTMFGLAIGSCVTVGGFAIGGISGGSLNPAVSFGINAADLVNGGSFLNALIYSALELGGAVVAALVVKLTHGGVGYELDEEKALMA